MDQDPKMQGTQPETSPTPAAASVATSGATASTTQVQSNDTAVVPPPADVAEPVSSTAAMPVQTIEPVAPPKKKRTGLIATIVILLLALLAGVGVAIWYFAIYSNPEKVAYDAVTGFLKQPNMVSDGMVIARTKMENGNNLSVIVGLDSKTTGRAGESAVTVKTAITDESGAEAGTYEYEVEAGSIFTEDGVIYIRINKVVEAVDKLIDDIRSADPEAYFGDNFDIFYDLLGDIDGEWWQISVPDLVDEFIDDNSVARPIKDFYTCVLDTAHQDIGAQIASVYDANRFLNVKKIKGDLFGDSTYRVTFDNEKMASFMNGTLDIDAGKEAEKCVKNLADELDGTYEFNKTYVDAGDIEDISENVEFEMIVSNFGHELKAISATAKSLNEGEQFTAGFEFTHPEVTVSAPESYRPVSELLEGIVDAVMEFVNRFDPADNPDYELDGPWNDNDDIYDDYSDDDWMFEQN